MPEPVLILHIYAYFQAKFDNDLKPAMQVFKAARYFSPTTTGELKPVASDLDIQLVRIGKICDNFEQFNDRYYKLTSKLIKQGFWYT